MRVHRISVGSDETRALAIYDFIHERGFDRVEIERVRESDGYLADIELAVVMPKGKSAKDLSAAVVYFRLGYNAARQASCAAVSSSDSQAGE